MPKTTSDIERITRSRVLTPTAAEAHVGNAVTAREPNVPTGRREPYVIHDADTGAPVVGVFPLADSAMFRRAVLTIEMASVARSNAYGSRSRTFGYRPRRPTHFRESCGITSIAQESPAVEQVLEHYADQFSAMLNVIDPSIAPADAATLGDVLPEWRFGEAKLWTSGVVNDTAQLPYHRDRFNFSTWSAMPVVRRGVRGGHLHLPEYDIVLPCTDATVILFPGERYVHGVTPMHKLGGDSYRFSVVYYALRGMKTCLEYAAELSQGTAARTQRETDMAERLARGDTAIPNYGGDVHAIKGSTRAAADERAKQARKRA